MKNKMKQLTEWFKNQVGIQEKEENNVVYNTIYYGREVSGDKYPWCCAFIWVGFNKNNMSNLFCGGTKTAYCPFVVNWARTHNQWITSGYREGDLILFDWNNDGVADHIGYCIGVNGSTVITIEGNAGDKVSQCYHTDDIMGAYRINYPTEPTEQPPVSSSSWSGTGEARFAIAQPGDSLWSIAQKYLGNGLRWEEIYKLNNLNSTTILIGQKLKLPEK